MFCAKKKLGDRCAGVLQFLFFILYYVQIREVEGVEKTELFLRRPVVHFGETAAGGGGGQMMAPLSRGAKKRVQRGAEQK